MLNQTCAFFTPNLFKSKSERKGHFFRCEGMSNKSQEWFFETVHRLPRLPRFRRLLNGHRLPSLPRLPKLQDCLMGRDCSARFRGCCEIDLSRRRVKSLQLTIYFLRSSSREKPSILNFPLS